MVRANRRLRGLKPQAGMTMIELLIAAVVMVVGLLAIMGIFALAIGNNGRSKVDTSATMLSQAVIEQISAVLARGGPSMVKDCKGTTWNIETAVGGAQLKGATIDFSQSAPPANYHMDFVVCSDADAAIQTVYDVRWHISTVSNTYLVTVSAKPKNMGVARFAFALPVTMRSYVGKQ
ncbi:MAG TPA: hypothetical protein VD837_14550 [Terriglobales bacterium]|nr:hypothetical protein [Terriglobales bacterium]